MSKQTDYVNAQFDNAEAKIQALFDSISREIVGSEVSTAYFYSGTNGLAFSTVIYKKGNAVNLLSTFLLNTGHGWGHNGTIPTAYDWGMPPESYYAEQRQTIDGQEYYKSVEIYPDDGVLRWYVYNSGAYIDHYVGPAGPLVIRASW